MQPLEAARLFTSALSSQGNLSESQFRQVKNIDHSLKVANDLLADLGEIARIESGNITAHYTTFSVNDLFEDLAQEFSASAKEYQVEFRVISCKIIISRQIIENLSTYYGGNMQKQDILNILYDWSFWDKDFEQGYERPELLACYEHLAQSTHVMTVVGPRRAG